MQLENSRIMLLLLSLTIIAAGCVDNGSDAVKTDPLEVNDFSVSPNPTPADRQTNFRIQLENTGDADAEDVAVRLFGPTFATGDGQDRTWRNENGGAVNQKADRTRYIGDVRAPTDQSPSIPQTQTITLLSPAYPEGREPTSHFSMDVFYKYSTTAETDLEIVTAEHFANEDMTRSQPVVETSSGPVQMDIQGTLPKVQYQGDESDQLCVVVRNDGVGDVFSHSDAMVGEDNEVYDVNSDNRDQVRLSVEDVGNINFEPNEATVTLIDGENVQCFDWTADGLIQQREQTVNIEIDADYGYVKTEQTSVTVEGRNTVGDSSSSSSSSSDSGTWTWEIEEGTNDYEAVETWFNLQSDEEFNPENFCEYAQDENEDMFDEAGCEE